VPPSPRGRRPPTATTPSLAQAPPAAPSVASAAAPIAAAWSAFFEIDDDSDIDVDEESDDESDDPAIVNKESDIVITIGNARLRLAEGTRHAISRDETNSTTHVVIMTASGRHVFRAVLHHEAPAADAYHVCANFEQKLRDTAPGQVMRGRDGAVKVGKAPDGTDILERDPNLVNYPTYDTKEADRRRVSEEYIGSELAQRHFFVTRVLSFPPGGVMTPHFDSRDYHNAKIFQKLNGYFTYMGHEGDDPMGRFTIEYSGYWAYSMIHEGFLSPEDGGLGGKHHAGNLDGKASFSVKIMTPQEAIASEYDMQLALDAMLSWKLDKRPMGRPMLTQDEIFALPPCDRVRAAIGAQKPFARAPPPAAAARRPAPPPSPLVAL
jgi:hypothetical protein